MATSKLRSQLRGSDEDLKVDMSPMIDMVFLLLIFFIVTANLKVIEMDKRVEVPVAESAEVQENSINRIVVNVYDYPANEADYDDPTKIPKARYSKVGGKEDDWLYDDAAISDFITTTAREMDATVTPQLHLRGHRGTQFKHVRRIIGIAAEAGVSNVVFVSYGTTKAYK